MTGRTEIEEIKKRVLGGQTPDRETIISMLEIEPNSREAEYLRGAAREVSAAVTKNRAYLWGAMGVDYKACSMNCDFCSLGEAWGLVKAEKEFSYEEIRQVVAQYAADGVRWIVLRTTEFYSLGALGALIRDLRRDVAGDYELGLNVGEFDLERANALHKIGVQFIYHSIRLREGQDTRFLPEERLNTLQAVKDSPLNLVFLVEPIGVEHTNEELADLCLTTVAYRSAVSGAMARIPVEGTPLGRYPQLSQERLAQIIAVIRLACGFAVEDICVHPASELALNSGANVTVIETGAIPRDTQCCPVGKWNSFTAQTAKAWFEQSGYTVYPCAQN